MVAAAAVVAVVAVAPRAISARRRASATLLRRCAEPGLMVRRAAAIAPPKGTTSAWRSLSRARASRRAVAHRTAATRLASTSSARQTRRTPPAFRVAAAGAACRNVTTGTDGRLRLASSAAPCRSTHTMENETAAGHCQRLCPCVIAMNPYAMGHLFWGTTLWWFASRQERRCRDDNTERFSLLEAIACVSSSRRFPRRDTFTR